MGVLADCQEYFRGTGLKKVENHWSRELRAVPRLGLDPTQEDITYRGQINMPEVVLSKGDVTLPGRCPANDIPAQTR